ncbi:non-hydrolyzing UDP-N-acetylglucosamine 2-epimerase [Sphingomonas astaxanthinifaciens]|uniref:UDP-N-acetylglucosamine 2-epimerase (non-hydrolyzing) n=1 Tax=Sphingomonas astaxanthinifaciens DSM 22298 TaxID=1123267 RepID=A0ABQ5ZAR2_9SPHN|nr:UDP-N-acetylglucosamine 2-epimerase (non-hydrolyzing) [Sphingomonas astaxanthinifaciens]GLR48695.1 UDP-N-acetyl glucosamine 2-epimerase [Sphingomonas astaxanthinifaciens DSM 22298]
MLTRSITLVIGTRPEAIKLAPVAHALAARGLAVQLAFTGQHATLDPASFGLGGLPALRLRCRAGNDPRLHAEAVAAALTPALRGEGRPAMLIVQGDTSSALGGALAASAAGVPLAHVEAGLRSHDLSLPWPEEGNRLAIDALADLLFAPTEDNAANLATERLGGEVHVTGNSAIDALFEMVETLPPRLLDSGGLPRLLVTCHRRENWGAAFAPIGLALIELARSPWLRIEVVLHNNPAMAGAARLLLGGHPRIRLLPPMDHRSMISALRSAHLVLSDSGGIQEEAPALGVPLLVLRSKTERPEAVASGNSLLVGSDRATIVAEVNRLLDDRAAYRAMAVPALPFGDGKAAARIAAITEDWLVRQHGPREKLIA